MNAEIQVLVDLIKDTSLTRLKTVSGLQDLFLENSVKPQLMYAPWLSLIMVSGAFFRINFKAHYKIQDLISLSKNVLDLNNISPAVSQRKIQDFMREYCNITAGSLKAILEEQGFQVGMSLPLSLRGFDEIFAKSPNQEQSFEFYWAIVFPGGKMVLTCEIEVLDFELLKNIKPATPKGVEDEGEVDFL